MPHDFMAVISLDDLPQLPAEDPAVRLELEAAAAEKGSPAENAKP